MVQVGSELWQLADGGRVPTGGDVVLSDRAYPQRSSSYCSHATKDARSPASGVAYAAHVLVADRGFRSHPLGAYVSVSR
jgi:hypothetical protein